MPRPRPRVLGHGPCIARLRHGRHPGQFSRPASPMRALRLGYS